MAPKRWAENLQQFLEVVQSSRPPHSGGCVAGMIMADERCRPDQELPEQPSEMRRHKLSPRDSMSRWTWQDTFLIFTANITAAYIQA
ncbi:hypothetical protein MAXJ12_34889 [Mesorhizobium alhagi CCNWXJ12-2]|uniref:Uncharacterized protein n=1 Tax=Mesorhizobium alhagi CCNWXJ12-2 TaxID=1107882 RepID=H0I3B3_9HYPH|nr:hypothetical protein MAXJ12_34889 [Mesorhizobium alhagi CCNWXJ12-2]